MTLKEINNDALWTKTPTKAREVKPYIGQQIRYLLRGDVDPHRGTFSWRYGTVEAVQGRNVVIEGDYKWLPDFTELWVPKNNIANDKP